MKVITSSLILLISLCDITEIAAQTDFAAQMRLDRQLQVDRYTGYKANATIEESNPLLVITQINFPSNVKTVYEAIEHALQRSGYRVDWQQSAEAYGIFSELEIPMVHRKLNLMTLKDVVATLAGEVWQLSVDPVKRKLVIQLHAYAPWQVAGDPKAEQIDDILGSTYAPKKITEGSNISDLHRQQYTESVSPIGQTVADHDTMDSSASPQVVRRHIQSERSGSFPTQVAAKENTTYHDTFADPIEQSSVASGDFIKTENLVRDSEDLYNNEQNIRRVQYIPGYSETDDAKLSKLDNQALHMEHGSRNLWSAQPVIKAKEGVGSLDEAVIVHYSSISVKELIEILIPDGWIVHYEVSDAVLRQKLVSHAESSRRSVLLSLFKELNLKALFYPGQAVVLVAEKEPRSFTYSNAPLFKAIDEQNIGVPAESIPDTTAVPKSQLDMDTILQNVEMIKNLMNRMETVPK